MAGLALGLILWTSLSTAAPVRLAIVADQPPAAQAADFLTVALSTNREVVLLERVELERAWREQTTSVSAGDRWVKAGQVLGADGLIFLEKATRERRDVLTAKLIAVKPGVALSAESIPWPLENPKEWAQHLAPTLARFFPKLTVLQKDAIPVSVLNLRSTLNTRESRSLEQELTLLLIHRLTQERNVFVLERHRLAEALFEKELASDAESAFWTGRYLIDGVLDKDGYDAVRLSINGRLVSPQGGAPVTVEVSSVRSNLTEIVEMLATKLLTSLQSEKTSTDWRPLEEAKQFEDEARWALRWKLLPEAQTASESAWALGRRTPEVATLRIKAYTGAVRRDMHGIGSIMVPRYPSADALRSALRVVELCIENGPLIFANSPTNNAATFAITFDAFERATALLDGFYYDAELRVGCEEKLADLRAGLRQLAVLLEQNRPTRAVRDHLLETRFDLIKWNQGGLWFEHPQEASVLLREMMEKNYHPEGLPFFAAWNWQERQRVPQIMRQFIEGLRTSTNGSVRMQGLYLAVEREPFDSEGKFRAREAELLAGIWENRHALFSGDLAASLLSRTEKVLLDKYRYIFGGPLAEPAYTNLLSRLRLEYLTAGTNWHPELFAIFFPRGGAYSRAEAERLAPLVGDFKKRLALKRPDQHLNSIFNELHTLSGSTNRVPPAYEPPAALEFVKLFPELPDGGGVEAVSFLWWPVADIGPDFPRIQHLLLRDGKLWAMIRWYWAQFDSRNARTSLAAVDPLTGKCENILFPEKSGVPDDDFEVTADSIYFSSNDHLERYRFASRRWEKIPVPMVGGARMLAAQDRLYLATREGFLEFNPTNNVIQVLASGRRRPAETELDERWTADARWMTPARLFRWPDGTPSVQISNMVFLPKTGSAEWIKRELPLGQRSLQVTPFFSDQGLELLLEEHFGRDRIIALRDNGLKHQLLLEHPKPRQFQDGGNNVKLDKALGPAKWTWPIAFQLGYEAALVDGDGLWHWQPRKTSFLKGPPAKEPITYPDDRGATLLRFEPGRMDPLPVAIRFERDGKPVDPFAWIENDGVGRWQQSRLMPATPYFFCIPQGLIVANWQAPGHWFIPRQRLDARLKHLREKLPRPPVEASK